MTAATINPAWARRSTATDALLAALGCLAGCWTTITTRARWFTTVPAHVWLASYLMMLAVIVVGAYAAIRLHNLLPGPVSVSALKAEFPLQLQPYIAVAPASEPASEPAADATDR